MFGLVDLKKGAARKRFRQSIKDEWGCCAYCGKSHGENGHPIHLTIDHVKPRAHGGNSMRANLIPACFRCNAAKGSVRDWQTWYRSQNFFCAQRAARIETWMQPVSTEDLDLWFSVGGVQHGTSKPGATVSVASDCHRGSGLLQGGACRGITRLLGGEIQAEASLSC